jgi:alpha-L-fucosidase 2
MYTESGPVIETPLSGAQSLNDILLSSWGDRIRLFPGVPDGWKDVTIHNMRTEGAFLVSAVRKDGKTQWVRVKSLAGEPCRIKPALEGEIKIRLGDGGASRKSEEIALKKVEEGVYTVALKKGDEVLLYSGEKVPEAFVVSVAAEKAKCNYYGLKIEGK